MGMSIEKIIEIYNDYDRISGTLISGNSEEDTKYNFETIEAIQSINVILHKYQKIEQIMKSKKMDALNIGLLIPKDMACVLHEIKEVIEDGNNKI